MLKINVDEFFENFCCLNSDYDAGCEGHTIDIKDEDREKFIEEQTAIFSVTLDSFIEEEEVTKEKIVKYADFTRGMMLGLLRHYKVDFVSEMGGLYTPEYYNDFYRIDIWVENSFIQIFYDKDENMTHWEVED